MAGSQLEALLAQVGVGVHEVDPRTGLYARVSPTFCDLTGRAADDLVGRSPSSITCPEDVDSCVATLARLSAAAPASATFETSYVRPDGRRVRARVTWSSGDPREGSHTLLGVAEDVTEARRAEALLRESEARSRALVDEAADAMFIHDAEGRFTDVNRAACESLGYSREELLRLTVTDVGSTHDLAAAKAVWARIEPGKPFTLTGRHCRKDGTTFPVEIHFGTFVAEGRRLYLGLARDLSEQVAAQDAVRQGERRVAELLRTTPSPIFVTRRSDGTIVEANDAFVSLLGWSRAELLGKTTADIGLYADPGARERVLEELDRTGAVVGVNIRARDRAGAALDVILTGVTSEVGGERCAIGFVEDVTARKRDAEALRASEDRYRVLVDNLDDIVFSVDLEGRLTFISLAVSRFGYQADQLIGRSVDELIHPDDATAMRTAFASILENKSTGPHEFRWIDAFGKPHVVRNSTRPLVRNGRIVGVTGLAVDVTQQRDTEEQLRAAQRMEAIGRLAGGVAHDFNNILGVILSYTELAVTGLREEDPLRGDLREVLQAAKRAAGLTRQLLAFSRRQVLEPERLDLGALIAGLGKMLHRLIGEDVELEISSADDLFETRLDRGQIEQVVMNLAINARDAMPDGGRLSVCSSNATVDAERASALEVDPGDYVELSVADTGCGMGPDVRARIFEPFFTTKGMGKGTGLGLSMVHGIVKQSGGGISVETEPGAGTTFRVFLPRSREENKRAASQAPRRARLEPGGRESILVVEDEDALRRVIGRMLSSIGYDVTLAANPGEALLICERQGSRLHLVLTDVVMPGMNGRELAERLRPLCPGAKVIFISGYTDEAIAHHGVLESRFLRKPFDRTTLASKVRSVLDEVD